MLRPNVSLFSLPVQSVIQPKTLEARLHSCYPAKSFINLYNLEGLLLIILLLLLILLIFLIWYYIIILYSEFNPLNWRHRVSAQGCWLRAQVHKIQCHLFPPISSLSPSCHLSAWQHKVLASRCNPDYMLVTHFMHSGAYNVWKQTQDKACAQMGR